MIELLVRGCVSMKACVLGYGQWTFAHATSLLATPGSRNSECGMRRLFWHPSGMRSWGDAVSRGYRFARPPPLRIQHSWKPPASGSGSVLVARPCSKSSGECGSTRRAIRNRPSDGHRTWNSWGFPGVFHEVAVRHAVLVRRLRTAAP
jgi:hypothetical protein